MDVSWIIDLYAGTMIPFKEPSIPGEVHKIREKYRKMKPEAGVDEGEE